MSKKSNNIFKSNCNSKKNFKKVTFIYEKPKVISEKMFERAALSCLKCDFGGASDPATCTTLAISTS